MIRLYLIFLTFLFAANSYSQKTFNLIEAIDFGIENHASMKLDQLELVKANAEIREYIAVGLPKINTSLDYQYYIDIPTSLLPAEFFGGPPGTYTELRFGLKNSLVAGVRLNTLVFDGSFFTGLKAQKLYRELVKKEANSTVYDIKKNITNAYLSVLIAEKNKAQLDKNFELIKKNLEETELIFENGLVEKLDVDRLTLSVDNLAAEINKLEYIIELSKNLLKFQMSYPLDQDIILTEDLDDLVDQVLVARVDMEEKIDFTMRPEYEALKLTEELTDVNVRAIRSGYLPSLSAFGSYQANMQRDNIFDSDQPGFFPATIVGASLNLPIWDGNDRHSKIQKAKVDREMVTVQIEEFERAVSMEVQNARIQFQNAKINVNNTKRSEALAYSIFEVAQVKFREGVGSSLEISQAESELYTAQSNYINALFELVEAKSNLDFALGKK